jgi:hypothetical protein
MVFGFKKKAADGANKPGSKPENDGLNKNNGPFLDDTVLMFVMKCLMHVGIGNESTKKPMMNLEFSNLTSVVINRDAASQFTYLHLARNAVETLFAEPLPIPEPQEEEEEEESALEEFLDEATDDAMGSFEDDIVDMFGGDGAHDRNLLPSVIGGGLTGPSYQTLVTEIPKNTDAVLNLTIKDMTLPDVPLTADNIDVAQIPTVLDWAALFYITHIYSWRKSGGVMKDYIESMEQFHDAITAKNVGLVMAVPMQQNGKIHHFKDEILVAMRPPGMLWKSPMRFADPVYVDSIMKEADRKKKQPDVSTVIRITGDQLRTYGQEQMLKPLRYILKKPDFSVEDLMKAESFAESKEPSALNAGASAPNAGAAAPNAGAAAPNAGAAAPNAGAAAPNACAAAPNAGAAAPNAGAAAPNAGAAAPNAAPAKAS